MSPRYAGLVTAPGVIDADVGFQRRDGAIWPGIRQLTNCVMRISQAAHWRGNRGKALNEAEVCAVAVMGPDHRSHSASMNAAGPPAIYATASCGTRSARPAIRHRRHQPLGNRCTTGASNRVSLADTRMRTPNASNANDRP